MKSSLKPAIAAFLLLAESCDPLPAQAPPAEPARRPIQAYWPATGIWHVFTVGPRNPDVPSACLLTTGYNPRTMQEEKIWGLRVGVDELALISSSRRPADVAGDDMSFSVDGRLVGRFPVTERPAPAGGLSNAVASSDDGPAGRQAMASIHAGSRLRLNTGPAGLEATIDRKSLDMLETSLKSGAMAEIAKVHGR